jgi:hypothetical protein
MKIKIFCRCSFFLPGRAKDLSVRIRAYAVRYRFLQRVVNTTCKMLLSCLFVLIFTYLGVFGAVEKWKVMWGCIINFSSRNIWEASATPEPLKVGERARLAVEELSGPRPVADLKIAQFSTVFVVIINNTKFWDVMTKIFNKVPIKEVVKRAPPKISHSVCPCCRAGPE